jgi:soluble lytic murein transglycosylase
MFERLKKSSSAAKVILVVVAVVILIGTGILIGWLTTGNNRSTQQANNPPTTATPRRAITPLPTQAYSRPGFSYELVQPSAGLPTPNLKDPATLLRAGNILLNNGQLNEAINQFREIISAYPENKEAPFAMLGLGRAFEENNRWQDAADTYQKFLTQYPNSPDRRLAYFGLGTARKTLGQCQPAITSFQQYQKETSLLDGYVNFEIAECYTRLQSLDQAINHYQKTAGDLNGGSNLLRATALDRIGDYYANANNPTQAINAYNRILEFAKVPDYRAGVYLKIARNHIKANQAEQGYNVYNVLADQYMTTPSGIAAIQALVTANPNTVNDYLKGYLAFSQGNYTLAQESFYKFIGRLDPAQPVPAPAATMTKDQKEKSARARYYIGLSWERLKDVPKAVAEYKELQNWLPGTAAAEEGLWQAGSALRRQEGKEAEAYDVFGALVAAYPNNIYTERALFAQFQMALILNKVPEAVTLTENFDKRWTNSYRRDEMYYKLGKAHEAANNPTAAKAAFAKLLDSSIDGYYSARAIDNANKIDPNSPKASSPTTHPSVFDPNSFTATAADDRKALETWLIGWTGSPSTTLDTARTAVWADAGVQRSLELRRLGWLPQSEREAQEATERFVSKPLELYNLSLIYSEQLEFYYSIEAAKSLYRLYQQKTPTAGLRATPVLLQKLVYPLAYNDVVLEFSQKYQLDPLLLLGYIKQESAFDPTAVSSAEARGLTQVIPSTARAIASELGKKEFDVNQLLLPYTAIEFGSFYFAQRLKEFKGNPFKALGAYNGGSGNVYRWVKDFPPEKNFDDFVENIDFPETREYIKIVYSNYYGYRRIYGK